MPKKSAVKIVTDKKFEELIRPLSAEEQHCLEESIIAEGCRDALVVWKHGGKNILLDGHHRLEICTRLGKTYKVVEKKFDSVGDAVCWVAINQLGRRNLTPGERAHLVHMYIEPALKKHADERTKKAQADAGKTSGRGKQPQKSDSTTNRSGKEVCRTYQKPSREAASLAGMSQPTYTKACKVLDAGTEEEKKVLRDSKTGIGKAHGLMRKRTFRADMEAEDAELAKSLPESKSEMWEVRESDITKPETYAWVSEAFGHVDWIITDPPYEKVAIDLYRSLGIFSDNVLEKGGSVVAMSGYIFLPEIIKMLGERVQYYATLAYMLPNSGMRIMSKKMGQGWKPLLWYSKGSAKHRPVSSDVIESPAPKKDAHDWGQSVDGMKNIIKRLTKVGDVICDPFVGGGATALAAISLDRRFVGFDVKRAEVVKTVRLLKKMGADDAKTD